MDRVYDDDADGGGHDDVVVSVDEINDGLGFGSADVVVEAVVVAEVSNGAMFGVTVVVVVVVAVVVVRVVVVFVGGVFIWAKP